MHRTSERLLWLDAARVSAALAVVMVHVCAGPGLGLTPKAAGPWWVQNVVSSAVRWCVPVFVLISGALLLDPSLNESATAFLRRRVGRILIPLVFWSVAYLILTAIQKGVSREEVIRKMLEGRPYSHLWYLYMVPGLYLFTPFLRTYIRSSSAQERWLLIGLCLLLASANSFLLYFRFKVTANALVFFVPYLGYYLCGYQLRSLELRRIPYRLLLLALAGSILLTAGGTYPLTVRYGLKKGGYLFDYFSPPVIVMAVAVFLLAAKSAPAWQRAPASLRAFVERAAPATLGIYLLHPLVLWLLEVRGLTWKSMPIVLSIPVLFGATALLSLAITRITLRVPYLRRVVS